MTVKKGFYTTVEVTGWKAIRQQGNVLSSSSPWESELEEIKCNVSIAGSSIILLMR